jgi:hypothetical protein
MSTYEDVDAEARADYQAFMADEGYAEEMDRRGDALADRDYYNSGRAALDEMADEVEADDEGEWISDEEWLSVHPEAVRLLPNVESVQGVGEDG